jgi:hypothetical protein
MASIRPALVAMPPEVATTVNATISGEGRGAKRACPAGAARWPHPQRTRPSALAVTRRGRQFHTGSVLACCVRCLAVKGSRGAADGHELCAAHADCQEL